MSRLKALIEQQPDLTLDEVICAMRKHKVPSSRTAVWRFFQRHKITFKKSPNLFAPAYAREGRGASFNPLCTCMRACARGAVRSSLRSRRSRRRRFAGAVAVAGAVDDVVAVGDSFPRFRFGAIGARAV
jgi:hypothetical protein